MTAAWLARLHACSDDELTHLLHRSGLGGLFYINLESSPGEWPHDRNVRLHVYPEASADESIHSHRTIVASRILAGTLTNHATTQITPDPRGQLQVTDVVPASGHCHLEHTPIRVSAEATTTVYGKGGSYRVEVDAFHRIETAPGTVTLCEFTKPTSGFRNSQLLNPLGSLPIQRAGRKPTPAEVTQIRSLLPAPRGETP